MSKNIKNMKINKKYLKIKLFNYNKSQRKLENKSKSILILNK